MATQISQTTQVRTAVLTFAGATLATAQAFGLDLTPEQLAAVGVQLAATYGVLEVAVRRLSTFFDD